MKHLGYRIVRKGPKGLTTLYGGHPVNGRIGHIERPGGMGLYLGNTRDFAIDYYSGLAEPPDIDVLLTYEFDDRDLLQGEPDAYSSELRVRQAKLVNVEPLEEDEFNEELNEIRRRAGIPVREVAGWRGGKHPSEMTWQEFKDLHKTGNIRSDAYDEMVAPDNSFWKQPKSRYPVLDRKMNINGLQLEFRKTGKRNDYVKYDDQDRIMRDASGMALSLSPQEVKEKGYPVYDQAIMVFHGDKAIAVASNEFGAIGIWVRKDYQRRGIGSELLKVFLEENPHMRIGQMTPAGEEMSHRTWNKFSS